MKTSNPAQNVSVVASSLTFKDADQALIALNKNPSFFIQIRSAKTLGQAMYQFGFLFYPEKENPNKFSVEIQAGKIPDLACLHVLKKHTVDGSFLILEVDEDDVLLEFRDKKVSARDCDIDVAVDSEVQQEMQA